MNPERSSPDGLTIGSTKLILISGSAHTVMLGDCVAAT